MNHEDIIFTRKSVARILNCTPLTVAHRETRGIYPEPKRTESNYRYYRLIDIFALQKKTGDGEIKILPLLSELWDKGIKDPTEAESIIESALKAFNGVDNASSI